MDRIRLNKYLASLGVASRRKIDEMIEAGSISVNGKRAVLGTKVVPNDKIEVLGKEISAIKPENRYVILNKPRGVVSTALDTHGRRTVVDIVGGAQRLFPVGRLDQESEGLILLTNDGELTQKLNHPKFHVPKIYHVKILGKARLGKVEQMRKGVVVDGRKTAPCEVKVIWQGEDKTLLEIVLKEGRNRQIRKMCSALHLHLLKLKRAAIGPVELGKLKSGEFRDLTDVEVKALKEAAGLKG